MPRFQIPMATISPFCIFCGEFAQRPHNHMTLAYARMLGRQRDNFAVPACLDCHNIAKTRNFQSFWDKYEWMRNDLKDRKVLINLTITDGLVSDVAEFLRHPRRGRGRVSALLNVTPSTGSNGPSDNLESFLDDLKPKSH